MNHAATFPAVIDHSRLNGEQQQLNSQLWYILLGLVEGQASAIMANVEEFNGLEAWRQFYRRGQPRSVGHSQSRLNSLLQPTDLMNDQEMDWETRISTWEKRHTEYVALGGVDLQSTVKVGVLQQYLAPSEVRGHLLMNAARLAADPLLHYDAVKAEIESYVMAHAGMSSTPMDTNALGWGPPGKGKGDKGKGKGGGQGGSGNAYWTGYADAGRGGGKLGKNNTGWGKAGKTGKTDSKTWTGEYFEGYCSWCQKWGHKKATCWFWLQTQKGDSPGKGKKGKKGKGKGEEIKEGEEGAKGRRDGSRPGGGRDGVERRRRRLGRRRWRGHLVLHAG